VSNRLSRAIAFALVLADLVIGAAPAAARPTGDRSVDLDAAQRALGHLRYEEARPLLDRAWRSGQNGPQALAALFELQGKVAATLGDEAAARRAFARWLAIDPSAQLEDGVSPKLAASFEAARHDLDGAALRIDVEVAPSSAAVALVVTSDPLAMIAGARASYRDEDILHGVVEGKGGKRVELPLPAAGHLRVVVAAVDSFGNRLVEREIVVAPAREHPALPPAPMALPPPAPRAVASPLAPAPPPPPPSRSILASPWLWSGLGAGFALAGGAFAWRMNDAQHDLDRLNATSASHSFTEAREVEGRLTSSSTGAYVGFSAAGACAVVAVILALGSSDGEAPRHVAIGPAPGGARVALAWSF
jgi:hypothetical protein